MVIYTDLCSAYVVTHSELWSYSCTFEKATKILFGPDNYLELPPKIDKILNLPHE